MRRKYLSILKPSEKASKNILYVNPTLPSSRIEPEKSIVTIIAYTPENTTVQQTEDVEDIKKVFHPSSNYWIDIGGLRKSDIEKIGDYFQIHFLITEDILSVGQRPKMDESDNSVYALLNMLFFNEATLSVETEQVSFLLGKNYVISFQEDPSRDLFDPIRKRLSLKDSRIRNYQTDYLFYSLIDVIVDNYFVILEKMGEKIEYLEEEVIRNATTSTLTKINLLRKEMVLLKRNITPVREIVNGILRSDSELIDDRTLKYFKDVYDHIVQASELSENYRDMVLNLHDLYLSELNLKMNEVMKVMAIVTCLLAPATVIGGIFGMNFSVMPWLAEPLGFYLAVATMFLIPVIMMYIFKKRGWF